MTPLQEIQAFLRSPEAADMCKRIDAKMKAPDYVSQPIEWSDPPPDPFGMEWGWLTAVLERSSEVAAVPQKGELRQPEQQRRTFRYVANAGGIAIAALILLAVGFFLNHAFRDRDGAYIAQVSAKEGIGRGGKALELSVSNQSNRRGFITIVGPKGARSPIHYEEGRGFIEIAAGQTRTFELPVVFVRFATAIVVITATPAGDSLVKAVESGEVPDAPQQLQKKLIADLERFGFTGMSVNVVELPSAQK